MSEPPVVLTVAGSDSGAGAGAQVDLKTFCALGVFGVTALTAVTVQNTVEVRAVHRIPPRIVAGQIHCVLDDFDVAAAKTGMLASAATVRCVASALRKREVPHVVVDPVMVSSSGTRLLDDEAIGAYIAELFPVAELVTPNLGEAAVLTGRKVTSLTQMESAAQTIASLGARAVLVKGGHRGSPQRGAVDVLFDGHRTTLLRGPWVASRNVHGTGCTLSAAVASRLALGDDLDTAVDAAKHYVLACIAGATSWSIGHGLGPLDHFGRSGDPTGRGTR